VRNAGKCLAKKSKAMSGNPSNCFLHVPPLTLPPSSPPRAHSRPALQPRVRRECLLSVGWVELVESEREREREREREKKNIDDKARSSWNNISGRADRHTCGVVCVYDGLFGFVVEGAGRGICAKEMNAGVHCNPLLLS
jgi:hypothetical protein